MIGVRDGADAAVVDKGAEGPYAAAMAVVDQHEAAEPGVSPFDDIDDAEFAELIERTVHGDGAALARLLHVAD